VRIRYKNQRAKGLTRKGDKKRTNQLRREQRRRKRKAKKHGIKKRSHKEVLKGTFANRKIRKTWWLGEKKKKIGARAHKKTQPLGTKMDIKF